MSIAEIFESGEKKQLKGHFRNLVFIAKADGIVSIEESDLLKKIAKHIGLSDEQANEILNNPSAIEINPPSQKEERYSRLINLIEMVNADNVFEEEELSLLKRYGIALGFTEDDIVEAVDVTLNGLDEGLNEEQILAKFMS